MALYWHAPISGYGRVAGGCEDSLGNGEAKRTDLLILQALVVADQLVASVFQQAVNNTFVDWMIPLDRWRCDYANIIFAYANLPEICPILGFIVDAQCLNWTEEFECAEDADLEDELPPKFLIHIMRRMAEYRENEDFCYGLDTSHYHIHLTDDDHKACLDCKRR
jgi:hypothetical protein